MSEVAIIVGVSIVAFVSTSLDNLFLLMGIIAGSGMRTRTVAAGYVASLACVLALGLALSYTVDPATDRWLRWLGVVPFSMGLIRLRQAATPDDGSAIDGVPSGGAGSVFAVMLASSGDSFGVFTSLMAESQKPLAFVVAATALSMATLWAALARWVVDHPVVAPRMRALDRFAVPPMLIAIGLYIFFDSATDG